MNILPKKRYFNSTGIRHILDFRDNTKIMNNLQLITFTKTYNFLFTLNGKSVRRNIVAERRKLCLHVSSIVMEMHFQEF